MSSVASNKRVKERRSLSKWEKAGIPFIILIAAWVIYSVAQPSVSVPLQVTPTSTRPWSVGQQPTYKLISVSDANAMIQDVPGLLVVDVRTPGEFSQGHIQGAINIPLFDLPVKMSGLDQSKPILVYCQTGVRSAQAASLLVNAGFTEVYDMDGGLNAWTSAGYQTVTT